MVIDIILGIIVISTMVLGFRRGFVYTVIHMAGWLAALVASFFLSPYVKDFLLEKTSFFDFLFQRIHNILEEILASAELSFDSMPASISHGLSDLTSDIISSTADNVTNFIFTILSFLLVAFLVKLVLFFLLHLFSAQYNDGFTGFFDGFFGLLAGFIRGMILVFILLALLFPVLSLINPAMTQTVMTTLQDSYVAKDLYDNNFILLIIRDFLA